MSDEDEKDKIENDSEEENNEIEKLSKKNNLKNNENLDNQEESQYNSEEDENYIDEKKPKKETKKFLGNKRKSAPLKKKKKKKARNKNMFIDREAEEDENDDESVYEAGGELTKEQQKEEMEKAMKQTSTRFQKLTDQNQEEYLEHIEQLEKEQKDDINEENMYIRPTSADPKIWLVKCKFGDEKEIMENLYHKYFYFKDNKNDKKERVKIYSVASFDNLKGKIFIEAYTERDVLFAVQGMSNVYQNSIQLVPINERAQIFEYDQVPKSKIFPNQLVRIKGGNYDGDLAKVISIEDPVNKIHVALVPRIFDNLKGKTGYNVAPFSKSKTFSRPRKLLFDKKLISNEELDHIKDLHEYDGDVVKYRNFKFMDGLLIKAVRRVNLETENVSPKEDELQKIGCYIDENDVYIDKNTKKKLTVANKINVRYKKGDIVKIVSEKDDEYNGQEGIVVKEEPGNNVLIELKLGNEIIPYSIPKNELVLVKHDFKNGDLVFAKFGTNKGRSGMIIQILENGTITIYDDITKTKFEAQNNELIFREDMEFDNEENEMFKIGELVKLKNSRVVCYIIESTKFIIKVVTNTNEVKKISVREVDIINLPKKKPCIDGKGNPLDIDNTVKVINGHYKGYKGVIKNIFNQFIFLLNNDFARTNGIFCEIKENLELLGSELLLETSGKGRINRRRIPNYIKDLMGKIVHVEKGNWKGYNGLLVGGNDKNVKLELIAKQKVVEIPFDYIKAGDVNSVDNTNESVSFNNQGFMKTPAYYIDKEKWE